jgi:hypothetical protein
LTVATWMLKSLTISAIVASAGVSWTADSEDIEMFLR